MSGLPALLDALFPLGHEVAVEGHLVRGTARSAVAKRVEIVGTADAAAVDGALALGIAAHILRALEGPPCPLVFLVDTSGQALLRHEELIGLNAYLAHVASTVDVARRNGFPSVSIVYGQAVSGGYLSLGLMANRAYALADAQIRVMDLHAMARVTKLPYEQLASLAQESPVFAPGAANYERMGALATIWPEPTAACMNDALQEVMSDDATGDGRLSAGLQRGGRTRGLPTAQAVLRALP